MLATEQGEVVIKMAAGSKANRVGRVGLVKRGLSGAVIVARGTRRNELSETSKANLWH